MAKKPSIGGMIAELLARPRPTERADKKNWSEELSRGLAIHVADGLRPDFDGILPAPDAGRAGRGIGHESRARTSKGVKKLDVNYSTPELGLALGVSVKTLNFRDEGSRRYTKNFTRIDNELRAEAMDYHERQPYAFMVAMVFLPSDACTDGRRKKDGSFGDSSFTQSIRVFRNRGGRRDPADSAEKFEGLYVACYGESDGSDGVGLWFFDVLRPPPRNGIPRTDDRLTFPQVLARIRDDYDARNNPSFDYAEDD